MKRNCADTDSGRLQIDKKLYVITRRDLSPGQQMLQAAHAAIEFQHAYPEIAKNWNTNSKYLIFLSVENEDALIHYLEKIKKTNLKYSIFTEPDINDQLTAIALQPGLMSSKLVSNLPLALKEL